MQLRNCPICNAAPATDDLIGPLVANHHKQEGRDFNLTYCACGDLIYLSPAPDESDIRAMYADSQQFDQDEMYRGKFTDAAEDFYSGRLQALLRKMSRPDGQALRVLEIGAGLSWMCRVAKKFDPQSVTVAQDISSEVVRECTWVDHYYVADLMDCSEIEAQAPYDIISLTHVIEHLVDPVGALKRLRRVIAPGGVVFITAPHRPFGWKRGNGIEIWRDWSYNHVPAHIQYFSRRSMERAARGAGFELGLWNGEPEGEQAFEAWLQPSIEAASMIRPEARVQLSRYRKEFSTARPFHHVIIDDFFEADKAEELLDEFPPFDPANAKNEFGEIGRKAVVTDIQKISPFYADVYGYLSSQDFLDFVSQITGIPDLVHDELMFGGGTHENLEGQELDPHVDFNFIESRNLHRRLNLLLYLNKVWEQDWGGCLELHSNPRRPKENRIDVIPPLFNRCVIFETSEHSWHGFRRIQLPEGKKHLSRKLLSIYLYTRDRPAGEVVPPHATFYVQRPLPAQFAGGHTLTEEDVRLAEELLQRRDGWIEQYQKKEIEISRRFQELNSIIESYNRGLRIPLTGDAVQEGPVRGLWEDGWVGSKFEVAIKTHEPIEFITIRGKTPAHLDEELNLRIVVNGAIPLRHKIQPGEFSLKIESAMGAGEVLNLRITADRTYSAVRAGTGTDKREIVMLLEEISVLQDTPDSQKLETPPPQVPLAGCGRQKGRALGYWEDGWIGSPFEVNITLSESIGSLIIEGHLPEQSQQERELTIHLNGAAALRHKVAPGPFSLKVSAQICAGEVLKLGITSDSSSCAARAGIGPDERELVVVLGQIRLLNEAESRASNSPWARGLGRLRRSLQNRLPKSR